MYVDNRQIKQVFAAYLADPCAKAPILLTYQLHDHVSCHRESVLNRCQLRDFCNLVTMLRFSSISSKASKGGDLRRWFHNENGRIAQISLSPRALLNYWHNIPIWNGVEVRDFLSYRWQVFMHRDCSKFDVPMNACVGCQLYSDSKAALQIPGFSLIKDNTAFQSTKRDER